jgi:hypothetical protein
MHILPLSAQEIENRLKNLPENAVVHEYNATSQYPVSGVAVAQALASLYTHYIGTEIDKNNYSGVNYLKVFKQNDIYINEVEKCIYQCVSSEPLDDGSGALHTVWQVVSPTVDQTYSQDSTNAISGTAVAEAIIQLKGELSARELETQQNKIADLSVTPTPEQYPTAVAVKGAISDAVVDVTRYTDEKLAELVGTAPETLNTLKELSDALGNDENFATTIANQIGNIESKVGDTSVAEQIDAALVWNNIDEKPPVEKGAGDGTVVIGEGNASGKYSIAGGTTDKSIVKDVVGADITDVYDSVLVSLLGERGPRLKRLANVPTSAKGASSISYGVGNQSIGSMSVTSGVANEAGSKGFMIKSITIKDSTLEVSLMTSFSQNTFLGVPLGYSYKYSSKNKSLSIDCGSTSWSGGADLIQGGGTTDNNFKWAAGDTVTIILKSGFYLCGQILAINATNGIVTIDNSEQRITLDDLESNAMNSAETAAATPYYFTISVPTKPEIGSKEIHFAATSSGLGSIAAGTLSQAHGKMNLAAGQFSVAFGQDNATGYAAFASGSRNAALGNNSHAEGDSNFALGANSHVEGSSTIALGYASHAEGGKVDGDESGPVASGTFSHAEGRFTKAEGDGSHSEGRLTEARGNYTHTEGNCTVAVGNYQHVQGQWNEIDTVGSNNMSTYAHIIGNGTSENDRKNIHTVDWNGNAWFKGDVTVGGETPTSGIKVATIDDLAATNNEITKIENLVGDKSVSQQLTDAFASKYVTAGKHTDLKGEDGKPLTLNDRVTCEGSNTFVQGYGGHAEGKETFIAQAGNYGHTEGMFTEVQNNAGHSEGYGSKASGFYAHAEGKCSIASGQGSHAEGACNYVNTLYTVCTKVPKKQKYLFSVKNASGDATLSDISVGDYIVFYVSGKYTDPVKVIDIEWDAGVDDYKISFSIALDIVIPVNTRIYKCVSNIASGVGSHSEGMSTKAISEASHAEGNGTIAGGYLMDEDGKYRDSNEAHDVVEKPTAAISCQHVEGKNTEAHSHFAHAEGWGSKVFAAGAHAEGKNTTVMFSGNYGHAEGCNTTVAANYAHAEGSSSEKYIKPQSETTENIVKQWRDKKFSLAKGDSSHVEGKDCLALGANSHAEGNMSLATGESSHAEGYQTEATGKHSHAEGNHTIVSASWGHAEGYNSSVSGSYGHAEGHTTKVVGQRSHAEGYNTVVTSNDSHVQGKYNYLDENENSGSYAHIVGNGTPPKKDEDGEVIQEAVRSNAHTLDWRGNAWFAGDVYVGSTSGKYKDTGSKKLATEEYVTTTVESSNFATEEFVNTTAKNYVDSNALIIGEQSLTPEQQSQIKSNLGLSEEKQPTWGEVPIAEDEIKTYTKTLSFGNPVDLGDCISAQLTDEEYNALIASTDFKGVFHGYRPDNGANFDSPIKKEELSYTKYDDNWVVTYFVDDYSSTSATITFSNKIINKISTEYLENGDSTITLLEGTTKNPIVLYGKPSGIYYLKGYFKLHSTGYRTVFDGRLAHITTVGSTTHMQLFVASTHAIHYYKINSDSYELTRMYFNDVLTAIEDLKNKPTIHYGTSAPDGVNAEIGDIYVRYVP